MTKTVEEQSIVCVFKILFQANLSESYVNEAYNQLGLSEI